MKNTIRRIFNAKAPPPMIWEPIVYGRLYPDRPYFFTHVRQGMAKLPPELQAVFREAGGQVFVSRSHKKFLAGFPDVYKHIPGKEKLYYSNGYHNPNSKYVLMPQTTSYGVVIDTCMKKLLSALGVKINESSIVLHELGHMLDSLNDYNLSKSSDFIDAIKQDLNLHEGRKLSTKDRGKISMLSPHQYLDSDDDVSVANLEYKCRELFAELFSNIINGTTTISDVFPNSAIYVKNKIDECCAQHNATFPDFNPDTYPKMKIALV